MSKQCTILKRTALAIVFGVGSTIVVCWGGFFFLPYRDDPMIAGPKALTRQETSKSVLDGRGAYQVVDPTWTLTEFFPARKATASNVDFRTSFIRDCDATGLKDVLSRLETEKDWTFAFVFVSGYPFKALRSVEFVRTGQPRPSSMHGFMPNREEYGSFRYPHFVGHPPLSPIWGGLLLDTLIYGAVWFVALSAFQFAWNALKWVKGQVRRGRDKCPRCGYQLQGLKSPACPECGAAFGEKTTIHRKVL